MYHCEYCHRDVESKADHLPYCIALWEDHTITLWTRRLCRRRGGGCKVR